MNTNRKDGQAMKNGSLLEASDEFEKMSCAREIGVCLGMLSKRYGVSLVREALALAVSDEEAWAALERCVGSTETEKEVATPIEPRDPKTCPYYDIAMRTAVRIAQLHSRQDAPCSERGALERSVLLALLDAYESGAHRGSKDFKP